MSDPLGQLRTHLEVAASDDDARPPHLRAFARWIRRTRLEDADPLRELAEASRAAQGPSRRTTHVAVLGYAASLDGGFRGAFREALGWLRERQYFTIGRPLTFEVDGLALLGVAVGILALSPEERAAPATWQVELLERSLASRRPLDWNENLILAARALLKDEPLRDIAPDLTAALAAKGLTSLERSVRAEAWETISSLQGLSDGPSRAAAQAAALTLLLRDAATIRPGAVTVEDVGVLLLGVQRSLKRWVWEDQPRTRNSAAARWEVENEYHVQDLLWAILAPVFPDLDDEEWHKSLGHHSPRSDLAIPSLELIVEVKFLRAGGTSVFSNVIKEVAADCSTYLQPGSAYRHIIAVVWDDLARTEQHSELRQGLLRLPGVRDAVVLSRPSVMVRDGRATVVAPKPAPPRASKPRGPSA